MAVKFFEKDGKTVCEVTIAVRSQEDRGIKIQRRESFVSGGLEGEVLQKKIDSVKSRLTMEAQKEVFKRELSGSSWGALIAKWRESLDLGEASTGDVKKTTTLGYVQALSDFTSDWFHKPAKEITPADVWRVLNHMEREGYSDGRRYSVKVAINQLFKWGMQNYLIKGVLASPTQGVSVKRKNSKRPEGLNHSQIVFLLSEAEKREHLWRRIWAFVLHTGARSGEAYEIRVKDVDREEQRLYFERKYNFATKEIEGLKDGEYRDVPINEELDALLIELGIESMGPEDYLLPRIRQWTNGEQAKILRAFCEEIGIPSICFHTLRALWATMLLQNGVPARQVMLMGGWSDYETMERYIRRAGIDVAGATDSLNFRRRERPGRVARAQVVPSVHEEDPTPVPQQATSNVVNLASRRVSGKR